MPFVLPTAAHAWLAEHWQANLEQTRHFLQQPSISAHSLGLREAANTLRGWLEAAGAATTFHGPNDAPIVYAEWNVGAERTLLVYGMYDVQPVDNQAWTTPPFEARIWRHPEGGESIVARGACNSKGPLMAFLHAIQALRASGGLPVNIKWTIEGEEEMGSNSLPDFYAEHRDMLRADAAFEPFWGQHSPESPPQITLGTKGVVGIEFVCRAGKWGGPREVVHSSVGAWVGSPAWRLMQALTSMVNYNQQLVVDGIPAHGQMLPGDHELLQAMAARFNSDEARKDLGIERFKADLPAYELLREMQFSPVLNVNGLQSGYLGDGSHTIIPTSARALCDLRLPPGLQVDDAIRALRRHLDSRGYDDIEIHVDSGYPAARTPLRAPVVQALISTYRAHGFEPVVRPVEPSATPYYLFTDVLGLNFSWGGLGTAGGSHAPDEWCSLAGLRALQASLATFLVAFAAHDNAQMT
jgi:acetylornithine deacetylase/succinyl-diaminopimelate desuccinylase-like protein